MNNNNTSSVASNQAKPTNLLDDVASSKNVYEEEMAAEFPSPPIPTATAVNNHNLTRNQFINTSAAVRTANIHKTRRNSHNNTYQGPNSESSTPNNYRMKEKNGKFVKLESWIS